MAANDPFGLTASGIPPELQAQYRGLTREQAIQEALLQQSQQPLGGVIDAGMFKVARSPWEGIAKIAQAYSARKGLDRTDERMGELANRAAQMQAEEVRRYQQMKAGVPGSSETIVDEQANGGEGAPATINAPAVGADPRGAVQAAMLSRNPMMQRLGAMDYQSILKREEPRVVPEGALVLDPDGKVVAENKKDFKPQNGFKAGDTRKLISGDQEIVQEYQADGTWKEVGKGPRFAKQVGTTIVTPQPVTPVTIQDPKNPNATIIVDGRTGKVIGAGPKLTETGKANFKQATTMQGIGADLQAAEDLLMGQVRDSEGNVTKGALPTGSGLGSAADAVAGFFGKTLDGAAEADSLKVVAGKLVQKVPRFEGPQSDKDVALYKQMAADAGNEKNPRERRVAAVRKMREIYSGYEDGSRGRMVQDQINRGSAAPTGGNDSPPPGAVRPR